MNNKDTMYFVSNEEADEDFRLSMIQSGREYKSSVSNNCDTHLSKLKGRGYITQALLDYVDTKGAISYTELESYYKHITGSNSFSHMLKCEVIHMEFQRVIIARIAMKQITRIVRITTMIGQMRVNT